MSPVLRWPGAKWNLSDFILPKIPKSHDCYLETCLGSGAVFFRKEPSNVEILNDIDGAVVNFFQVLREKPNELAALVAFTPWARDEQQLCRNDFAADDKLEQARRLLVAMWQGIGVVRHSSDGETSIGTNGWRCRHTLHQSPVATWKRLPERIQIAAMRLLDAQIENRPAVEVITRYRSPDVLIYCDPPYHFETRERPMYAHEMSDDDHRELLKALNSHNGPALLSGYDCALYEEILGDWQKFQVEARAQNNVNRTETLWLNRVCVERLEKESEQLPLF